ncbi:hypothetical protein KAJ02_08020 [Candidatus Bipolaricaulota bacterium]|nr:hypothetical protein [Candidatus Bipolaricaulota bacterium]MCK5586004.1 hypothetical protein [Candidatus Bipolaricaulota bacterium]
MKTDARAQERDPFRWKSTILLTVATVIVLAVFRQYHVAGGIVLGLLLYAGNLFLMMEIGRSLLRRGETSRAKPLAALSSTGRLLFLVVALSLIAVFLGREVVLGACGGILIAQVNLHFPRLGQRREER